MDNERTRDPESCSGRPGGGRGREPGSAADGFLLLVALLVVLAAAAFIALSMPQAPEIAAVHAYASTAILTDREPKEEEDQAPEAAEEKPEPFIVDDVRTEGVMYAFADVFCPIGC